MKNFTGLGRTALNDEKLRAIVAAVERIENAANVWRNKLSYDGGVMIGSWSDAERRRTR